MNPQAPSTGRLFVGREAELAALGYALDEAVGGHGGLTVITGEPGIGKSALVEEHLTEAERRGIPVARGRCFEADTAPPYGPWVSALQRLARAGHPPARSQLRRWLAGTEGEIDLGRDQLFGLMAAHLVESAAERGLVLVIEDAQWADASSLLLLRHLADDLATARVHALVTCRAEHQVSSDIARLSGARAIILDGLADKDVSRYLELKRRDLL